MIYNIFFISSVNKMFIMGYFKARAPKCEKHLHPLKPHVGHFGSWGTADPIAGS